MSLIVCLASGLVPLDRVGTVISVFSGISNGVFLFVWILAANRVSLCTVEAFSMAGGVVLPLIVSPFIFVGESVSIAQWVGSALLFAAMFCLSKNNKKTKMSFTSLILLIICSLGNFGSVFTKNLFTTFSDGSTEVYQLYTFIFVFATLGIMFLFMPKSKDSTAPKFTPKASLYILVAVVMLYLYEYFVTISSAYLSAIFYPLLYVISMPLTFLADVIIFKEKVTVNNVIGIILITLAGVLINF